MVQMTLQQAFDLALQHRRAGRLYEAEQLYRQILAQEPNHAEALHMLGGIARQTGRNDIAVDLIGRAIALKPNWPEAYNNLGLALVESGRFAEAVAACRQAITLKPDMAIAYSNLGWALAENGQFDEAITAWRQAIALKPDMAIAYSNLGWALTENGQFDEAIAACRQAIALKPDLAIAYSNLGDSLKEKGQLDEAISAYREAIRLKDTPKWRFVLAGLMGDATVRTAPAQFVRKLFDNYAARFDEHLIVKLDYHIPELLLQAVIAVAPGRLFDILDLGCGTGLCGVHFRPYARRLIGVDLSPNMLKKAAQRGIYDQLITADVSDALRDCCDSIDLILAGDVFIYVGDLGGIFPAAARALRPDGLFAFSIESYHGQEFMLHSKLRFAHSLAYIRQLAQRHGFAELWVQDLILRKEHAAGVPGWIVVLRKSGVGNDDC